MPERNIPEKVDVTLVKGERRDAIGSKGAPSAAHPGEMLKEEFLRPWGMSINWLAKALHFDASHLRQIVQGDRCITPKTALLLSRYFGTDPRFWLNQGSEEALRNAARCPDIMKEVARVEPLVMQNPLETGSCGQTSRGRRLIEARG